MARCPYAEQVREFIRDSVTAGDAAYLELPELIYKPASATSRGFWLKKINLIATREGAKVRCRCKSGGIEITILE